MAKEISGSDRIRFSILWPSRGENQPLHFGRAGGINLAASEVHVWAASLDVGSKRLETLRESLSPEERQRAARFRFDRHRNRFIAGRGLLREILSGYLNARPSELEFCYGLNGKPHLGGHWCDHSLQFNLAHSEDLALFAVTSQGAVGIDVEHIRVLKDAEELVERFFSVAEASALKMLPDSVRPAAFFNLWTRKEAWLKATGEGIGNLLHRVEVSFLPNTPARLEQLPADLGDSTVWSLHDLTPAVGFAAALAVRSVEPTFHCRQWKWTPIRSVCSDQRISL
jgi:4'-phosphopantetheinyl transferase